MIRPDAEGKLFISRWNALIRVLLVESSVKLVARTAAEYANFEHGTTCHPSNERLARETGYSERTVRTAWAVLRGMGLAERVFTAVAHDHKADEYTLIIPDRWKWMAILGPDSRKFTCLGCGKLVNPQGNSKVNESGNVVFDVTLFVFCPPPRKTKGRDDVACFEMWADKRKRAGEPSWTELGNKGVWELFRLSRGQDW